MDDTSGTRNVHVPSPPRRFVGRERLLQRLDEIIRHPVTCIAAPRGVGKTVLIAEWCRGGSIPVAWVNVRADADAEALSTRLGEAITAVTAGAHDRDRVATKPVEEIVARVGDATHLVVVLDEVDSPGAASGALRLAQRLVAASSAVHVVLVGCCAPPELVSMWMDGRAWQLADELYLDAAEVADVVAAHSGRQVPADRIDGLAECVDGWMAAAVLVGLSSPRRDRSASGMYAAAADSIDAYVSTVLLADLPGDLRDFVAATAVVDDLDPALCDVLTGADHSERQLARLRSLGFPIVHGQTGQARYVRPVRDALDRSVRRDEPAAHDKRLRLAAQWYRDWNRPLDAAGCLVRLGEWHAAEGIISEHLPRILDRDEIGRLTELVRQAPPEILREQVHLALAAAWVLRMDGRVSASNELLDIYSPHLSDRARMIADISRASVASWVADMEPLADLADAALEVCDRLGIDAFADRDDWHGDTSTSEYLARAHAAAQLACAYGAMWKRGERHLEPTARDAATNLPTFQLVFHHGITATFHALSGRAADALIEAYSAVTIAAQADLLDHRLNADASFALGEALRLQLRHDEAAAPLERAQRLAALNGRHNLSATAVASQAQLAIDAGRPDAALAMIAGDRRAHPHRYPPTVAGELAAAEGRAFNASGRFGEALRVLEQAPGTASVASVRVAALLGLGDVAGAQATVRRWPDAPTLSTTVRRALAAAVICEHTGDRRGSGLLRTALATAAPQTLGQPFLEHGPSVARLLRQRVAGDNEFARTVQRWLGDHTTTNPARLTAREDSVMSHIVAGRRVRDTAETMHISVNTVRAHLRAIHRKLGVDNRADAVRAWHDRQNLPPTDG